MTGPLHIGVTLPTSGEPHVLDAARSAEKAGLDGVWSPDHLLWGPFLDSSSLLSAAAAVTERIAIGWSVMLPALRPAGWAAKQVATVQQISRGRLQLGVGLGWAGPEWKAAGTSASGRAARTDAFLRALPDLLAGKPADPTPDGASTMTLEPAVPFPPLWVGGNSDAALHRAVRLKAGWLASMLPADALAVRVRDLAELAGQQAITRVASLIFAAPIERSHHRAVEPIVRQLTQRFKLDADTAVALANAGPPEKLAEDFARYRNAGADTLIVVAFGNDVVATYEMIAQVRALL